MTREYLFAGFGGQGLLFSGKVLAYKALVEDKHVSWLPSYGPEMRGGTANCSVVISDEPIATPLIANPDILVAMNLPSLDKYESTVKPGGVIIADSTLIERKVERTDVDVYYIPATQMATDMGTPTLANMILTGKLLEITNDFNEETVNGALEKCVSARHRDLLEYNLKAMDAGRKY